MKTNKTESYNKFEVLDYSNVEYFLVNSINIKFGELVDFCVLFEKSHDSSEKDSKIKYYRNNSTLGIEYLQTDLVEDIKKALLKLPINKRGHIANINPDNDSFGNDIYINKSLVENVSNKNKISIKFYNLDKTYSNKNRYRSYQYIKTYKFNKLVTVFLKENQFFIAIGIFSLDSIDEDIFNHFFKKINNSILTIYKDRENSIQRKKELIIRNFNPYEKIINSYTNLLLNDSDKDNIEITTHLFLYNPFDIRLYYSYLNDNMITESNIRIYLNEINKLKSQNISLELTKKQEAFIISKLASKFNNKKSTSFLKTEELLKNIANIEYLKTYFEKDKPEYSFHKWLFLILISSIPQEPWTGVAGYAADTKQFEISHTNSTSSSEVEDRWNPKNINKSYFYSKLMKYEQILGVGNKGAMAAFPLLDSGQIIGVLFASKNNKSKFPEYILIKLQALAQTLQPTIILDKNNSFISNCLNDLSKQTEYTKHPTLLVLQHLPHLFNVLLAISWEKDLRSKNKPETPSFVFGFCNNKLNNNQEELLPFEYSQLKETNKIDYFFSAESFARLKNIHKEKGIIIGSTDTNNTLPSSFKNYYHSHSKDRKEKHLDSSVSKKIHSSIVFKTYFENKEVYIQIFLQEPKPTLLLNINQIKEKFEIINGFFLQTEILKSTLDSRLFSIHELKQAYITPTRTMLTESSFLLNNLNNNADNDKDKINSYLKSIEMNLNYLTDKITALDPILIRKENSYSYVSLIELIKSVWNNFIFYMKFRIDYNTGNAKFYSLCTNFGQLELVINNKHYNIFDKQLQNFRKYFEIKFSEIELYSLFFTLLRNTYNPAVLIKRKNPKNFKITIELKDEITHIKIIYKNFGKAISKKKVEKIIEMFDSVKHSKLSNSFINYKDFANYKDYINSSKKHKGNSGIGLYNIANDIYSFYKTSENLISIKSDSKCTQFIFKFPKTINYEDERR